MKVLSAELYFYSAGVSHCLEEIDLIEVATAANSPLPLERLRFVLSELLLSNVRQESFYRCSIPATGPVASEASPNLFLLVHRQIFSFVTFLFLKVINHEFMLKLRNLAETTRCSGNGPYYMTVHPTNQWLYVPNNSGNTVGQYAINPDTGNLTLVASYVTGNGPASLTFDSAAEFAYVPNQSDNTVSLFSVNSVSGALTPLSPATIQVGNYPKFFTLSPAENYSYVTNFEDSTISQFSRDTETGLLTPLSPAAVSGGLNPRVFLFITH